MGASTALEASTGLNSCSEAGPELSSASQLAAVSTVREGSHLPSFTYIKSLEKNAAKHGKAARVSSAVQGSSEQVPAAVKSIQFNRVFAGSSAPNKQQGLKAVDGVQQ